MIKRIWERMDTKVRYEKGMALIEIPRELMRQIQIYPDDVVALTIHRETEAINVRRADVQDRIEQAFQMNRRYNGNE
jgi:antitoxin component of MazEF toxin-antitoxin module